MPVVHRSTRVSAPLQAVADFHHDTRALKRLTPPPVFVQIQHAEPLAEGSRSDFTLWFGPLPVRWSALHTRVSSESGFTDSQDRGPFRKWVHNHHWEKIDDCHTLLDDRLAYEHYDGWRGLLTRLLFPRFALWLMLMYRHLITRVILERSAQTQQSGALSLERRDC